VPTNKNGGRSPPYELQWCAVRTLRPEPTIMKKQLYILLLTMVFSLSAAGCSQRLHFLVCPAELASRMKAEKDLWNRREMLFNLDYRIVVVQDKDGQIIPSQHYLFKLNDYDVLTEVPYKVTFQAPLTIGTIFIIDVRKVPLGIAVKKKQDAQWRIYWLSKEDFIKAKAEAEDTGVVFLPSYEKLPIAKQVSDQ